MTDRQWARNIGTILFLGSSACCAAGGLLMWGLHGVVYRPAPVERPTLAGVSPAPIAQRLPITTTEPHLASFGAPAGWTVTQGGRMVENEHGSGVYIYNWPLPSGVPLATAADRRRAVAREARIEHAKVTEPVELTVGGRTVVEVAGVYEPDKWILHVFVFSDRTFSHVRCHAFGTKTSGFFVWVRQEPDWENTLPGCAAVAASVQAS